MYMGRSLLIFSYVIFKMAAWRPYWIFRSLDSVIKWVNSSQTHCIWKLRGGRHCCNHCASLLRRQLLSVECSASDGRPGSQASASQVRMANVSRNVSYRIVSWAERIVSALVLKVIVVWHTTKKLAQNNHECKLISPWTKWLLFHRGHDQIYFL